MRMQSPYPRPAVFVERQGETSAIAPLRPRDQRRGLHRAPTNTTERFADAIHARVLLGLLGQMLQLTAAAAVPFVMATQRHNAISRRLEHLQHPSARVTRMLNVRDLDPIAGCRARHKAGELANPPHAVATGGHPIDGERGDGLLSPTTSRAGAMGPAGLRRLRFA